MTELVLTKFLDTDEIGSVSYVVEKHSFAVDVAARVECCEVEIALSDNFVALVGFIVDNVVADLQHTTA